MSKKIKVDTPIEFEKDKRGLKDIPDTLRRHARMSKRQIRWSLIVAGIILVLLAAVMVVTNNLATAPLESYESAEIMKDAAGAEYVDIINKSRDIELREPENGDPVMLNGRRLILLRRSGVTADDYWFTVIQKKDANSVKNQLTKKNMIELAADGDNVLYLFMAQQKNIDDIKLNWPEKAGYTPEFLSYNSTATESGDSKSSAADESNEYSVLLHQLRDQFAFIQYTINESSEQISLFRGTDVDLKKVDDTIARLQIIRMAFIALLVAALGYLAYTLKAKKILSMEKAKQHLIRLVTLCVTGGLTAAVIFITLLITNQNDSLIRINPRLFPYTVDERENTMNIENNFDTFSAFITENEKDDVSALKTYIDEAESSREDSESSAVDAELSSGKAKNASGLADGLISFYFFTSDTENIWTPGIGTNPMNKEQEILNERPQVLKTYGTNDSVFSTITVDMHAETKDAAIPGSNFIWRILYYIAMGLIVVLFIAALYYFRYERDLGFPIINTAILILLMIVTLYPVLNTVAYSFSSGNAASRGKIGLIPQEFTTKSYTDIMDNYMLGAGWISVAKTIITTVLNLFWTGMLAFTLTRKEYALAKPITLIMVLTMYVNAGLIPNFLLISQTLNLKKTFWVYIIPTMYSCFNMIIIRTYIASLPGELVESARIDGAGDIRIYWQIIFPLCAPVLATVALFIAVGSWNSWFDTMLYNDSVKSLHTLQYVLKGKIATAGATASMAQTSTAAAADLAKTTVNSRTVQCATTVDTALPILLVYPFLQKYFVTGMALGSVKG